MPYVQYLTRSIRTELKIVLAREGNQLSEMQPNATTPFAFGKGNRMRNRETQAGKTAIRRVRAAVGTIAQLKTTAPQRLIQNPPPRQFLTSPLFPIPRELFVTGLKFRNRPVFFVDFL